MPSLDLVKKETERTRRGESLWQQADRIKVFADIWGGFEKLFVADRIKVVGWGRSFF